MSTIELLKEHYGLKKLACRTNSDDIDEVIVFPTVLITNKLKAY